MTQFANFSDDHLPAPSDHAPRTHAFRAAGDARHPPRLVVAAFDDADRAMADGRWLACAEGDTCEVRQ